MKSKSIFIIAVASSLVALSLLGWRAVAGIETKGTSASRMVAANAKISVRAENSKSSPLLETDVPSAPVSKALREEIDFAASAIESRVGVSACLELLEEGNNAIEEAYDSGWIIDVSLEDVEAALEAACKTPELEDDIEAARLAHRGSYRYYYKQGSIR